VISVKVVVERLTFPPHPAGIAASKDRSGFSFALAGSVIAAMRPKILFREGYHEP
jgi:hypothetical protein